jgi:K+-transporting ATPase KdpF subunit
MAYVCGVNFEVGKSLHARGGAVTALLLVYLVYALFRAEDL